MRRTPAILVLAVAVAAIALLGAWRLDGGRSDPEESAETSRIRSWARAEGGAGISVLPKRVPAADEDELRRLQALPGFHPYAMRCSSCHVLPDPGAYPGDRWVGKVDQMGEHIRRAGVVPPAEAELDSVRLFLRAASAALRED